MHCRQKHYYLILSLPTATDLKSIEMDSDVLKYVQETLHLSVTVWRYSSIATGYSTFVPVLIYIIFKVVARIYCVGRQYLTAREARGEDFAN